MQLQDDQRVNITSCQNCPYKYKQTYDETDCFSLGLLNMCRRVCQSCLFREVLIKLVVTSLPSHIYITIYATPQQKNNIINHIRFLSQLSTWYHRIRAPVLDPTGLGLLLAVVEATTAGHLTDYCSLYYSTVTIHPPSPLHHHLSPSLRLFLTASFSVILTATATKIVGCKPATATSKLAGRRHQSCWSPPHFSMSLMQRVTKNSCLTAWREHMLYGKACTEIVQSSINLQYQFMFLQSIIYWKIQFLGSLKDSSQQTKKISRS